MPQSPELAGGAGFSFEDRVSATYLTHLLQEGFAPGIEYRTVCRVALQQRDFGEPLDDVIVDFRAADGSLARLSLQVKRALRISQAKTNTDFREIVRDCWGTLEKPDFRNSIDRFGVATGQVALDRARDLRAVCELARASVESADFEARFLPDGNASAGQRDVRNDVVALLKEVAGVALTTETIHQFFAHFILIEFDFLHDGGTSLPNALNALRSCLALGYEAQAPSAWTDLCQLAREESGRSGVFDRPRLVRELATKVRLTAAPSMRRDVERLSQFTAQWLDDITEDVGGTRIDRPALLAALEARLTNSRVVQIRGLPGSGKSALLRRRVETELGNGPVVFLKSGRLEGTSWTSFATAIGLSAASLQDLLVDVGAMGSRTLYIDGIDRIEKQHQSVVRDVVRTVLMSPLLDNWKIVFSLRDSGIEPLRNWMGDLLGNLSVGTVDVGALDDQEAEALAKAKPHLRSLLFGAQAVREIVRRPFFAKVLNQNFGSSAGDATFRPQSEVDLIGNWWARGGYDADGQDAFNRQRAIVELGRLRVHHLEREIAVRDLSPSTSGVIDRFVADGILQQVRKGHSIRFAHDIFFEWAFFHVLEDQGDKWLDEIRACHEPPAVARVVELLSQSMFGSPTEWAATLKRVSESGMRSQWTRAWLLAPLATPTFVGSQVTFFSAVEGDQWRFLKKALVWFQAEKTTPNPNVLAGELPHDEQIRFADLLGWPSDFAAWRRFIMFVVAYADIVPVTLLPDAVSVFEVWQNALANLRNPVSDALLEKASEWLKEIDEENAAEEPPATPSRWTQFDSGFGDFRKSIVRLILLAAPARPDLTRDYLARVIALERLNNQQYSDISAFSQVLAKTHPGQLVDFALKHLKEELPEDRVRRKEDEARRAAEWRTRLLEKSEAERTELEKRALAQFSMSSMRSFSYHDWEFLSINDDLQNFWPPSPLREPFHSLFASDPDQALRLLRELSNHAIAAWRQLHGLIHDSPGTPVSLDISFPWGKQRFWGDDREYLWHRGTWAPKAIASGYMALEEWALAEIDRGRPVDELVQQIVADNECIAVLGTVATIALQTETISEALFPVVTSQRLLAADHNRMLHDFTDAKANLLGFRDKSELPHYQAIKTANERPVRRKQLAHLVSVYFLTGGPEISERTKGVVLGFVNNLPYQIEEHRNFQEAREHLTRQAAEYAELVQPENYRRVRIKGDDEQIAVVHVSPSASSPERAAKADEATLRLKEGNLWAWAAKLFENGDIGEAFDVPSAIKFAKSIDSPALFQSSDGEEMEAMKRGAVAATVAVALYRRDGVSAPDLAWARDVLQRALRAPENRDLFWSPESVIPWHPAIFVAHGLAADLRFGTGGPTTPKELLELVAHPLHAVSLAALADALSLWETDARLGWSALFIALSLCHIQPKKQPIARGEPYHSPNEIRAVLRTALDQYTKPKDVPDLPLPPPAWIKVDPQKALRGLRRPRLVHDGDGDDLVNSEESWGEPPTYWNAQYAASILSLAPTSKLVPSEYGGKFQDYLADLLAWTIEKVAPPWLKPGRRDQAATHLYEWTHSLGRTIGKVAGLLPLDVVKVKFLTPIFDLESEQCFDLLGSLVDVYICAYVYDAERMPQDATAFMGTCLERLLKDRAFNPKSYCAGELHGFDLPDLVRSLMFVAIEHASGAARYVNGDWSDMKPILPVVDHFVRRAGWASAVMSQYLMLCERSKSAYPADVFADQILSVIGSGDAQLKGWHGTFLPARIAALVQHFADRETPMASALAQKFLRILDLLVDMGDRRSAALQLSEIFREIQTV